MNRRAFLRTLGLGALVAALPPLPVPAAAPEVPPAVTAAIAEWRYMGVNIVVDRNVPEGCLYGLSAEYWERAMRRARASLAEDLNRQLFTTRS